MLKRNNWGSENHSTNLSCTLSPSSSQLQLRSVEVLKICLLNYFQTQNCFQVYFNSSLQICWIGLRRLKGRTYDGRHPWLPSFLRMALVIHFFEQQAIINAWKAELHGLLHTICQTQAFSVGPEEVQCRRLGAWLN